MPSRFTRLKYGVTPPVDTTRVLKKNWRSIRNTIVKKWKQKFKDIITMQVKKKIESRFDNQLRTSDGKSLPDHTLETTIWRHTHASKYNASTDKKMYYTGNLRKNLKVFNTKDDRLVVQNNAVAYKGKPVKYANFLQQEGWINFEIPDEWRPGGKERVSLIKEYERELSKDIEKNIYDRRFKRTRRR